MYVLITINPVKSDPTVNIYMCCVLEFVKPLLVSAMQDDVLEDEGATSEGVFYFSIIFTFLLNLHF